MTLQTWNDRFRASLGINRPAFPVVPLPWFEVRVPQRPRVADEKARGPRGERDETPRGGAAGRPGAHRGRGGGGALAGRRNLCGGTPTKQAQRWQGVCSHPRGIRLNLTAVSRHARSLPLTRPGV